MNLILQHWQDALTLLAMGFILQFRAWLVEKIVAFGIKITSRLERRLVKTERETLEWIHYRNRAAKLGHKQKTTHHCQDGDCKLIP